MNFIQLSDPLRFELDTELHGRPSFDLDVPCRVSHFAYLSGEKGTSGDQSHLQALCAKFDVAPPQEGVRYFIQDFGHFLLKWERHTEFTTYTIVRPTGGDKPFQESASDVLPADWLTTIPGKVLVALNIEVAADDSEATRAAYTTVFDGNTIGSNIAGGHAAVWTDSKINDDGFVRIAMVHDGLSKSHAGRVVQRLIEIFTYGKIALMALPLARDIMIVSAEMETELAATVSSMPDAVENNVAEEQLASLLKLGAHIEALLSQSRFRFAAAKAYYTLVEQRFGEIRETRISGIQRLSNYYVRHLAPPMRTCEAASSRLTDLSLRIDRAASLLRTQVELNMQRQNKDLLESMNRRAEFQLRLQETVEGLSVVAISYYAIGIVATGFKAMKAAGFPVDPSLFTGVAAPFIIGAIYMLVRRVKKRVTKKLTPNTQKLERNRDEKH